MKSIKLPFGLNENNILVHIADVTRGKKCSCTCPECDSSLVASKGNKNRWHFKHAVDNDCKGGFESAIHLAAKKIIREKKQITLSQYISIASEKDSKGKKHTEQKIIVENGKTIHFDSVQEEIELHGMRADIVAMKNNKPLIIEVFYRHKIDEQKSAKILKADISAIEINLSDLKPEDIKDWDTFQTYIDDPNRVKWIHNTKAYACYLECEKKLEKKIQEQEKKYKQEELEKQKKEQKKKELLLQALDELKIVSSKESIANFKREAEMHPYWKNNAQYLPFSLNNLPDYLNVDVPDGDWIFGCDRRIWQTAFFKSFVIWGKGKRISIKYIDNWLQNKIGCSVHQSVTVFGIFSKRYRELIPVDTYENRPSTWKTLYRYLEYLEGLGMLEFYRDIYDRRNGWFKIIKKNPEKV